MIKKLVSLLIVLFMLLSFIPTTAITSNAASTQTFNILFVGNSKMYFNNMPAMLANMLTKSNKRSNYRVLVKGSMSLNFHYHYIKDHPEQIQGLFNGERIDYLILNEQTDVQLVPYGTLYNSKNDPDPAKNYKNKQVYGDLSVDALRVIKKLKSYGMITKKGTKIILNATWNYSDLNDIDISNSNFERLRDDIKAAGYDSCEIAYSGNALKRVSDEMSREDGLLSKQELFMDERHTTQLGSYIEALALYKAMFNSNMVANYAGSVSAEKMQKSVDKYVIIENYIYRRLSYSNENDLIKRAFNMPKLKKIAEYQEVINVANEALE